jgi:GT2 family glycosyltransferase
VAVVVHGRSANSTSACLASIEEHAPSTTVVLVVGARECAEVTEIRARIANSRFVRAVEARAHDTEIEAANRGIDAAMQFHPSAASVLLLSAAARLRPGTLQAMRSCSDRRPDVGIVGCRVVAPRCDQVQPRRSLATLAAVPSESTASSGATECEADFASGACMLVDAALLRMGIRRDASYQRSGADADLCLRVRAIGRAIWVTQAATVEYDDDRILRNHLIGGHACDQVRLSRRTMTGVQRRLFLAHAWLVHPLLCALRGRDLRQLPAYFAGLWAGQSMGAGG